MMDGPGRNPGLLGSSLQFPPPTPLTCATFPRTFFPSFFCTPLVLPWADTPSHIGSHRHPLSQPSSAISPFVTPLVPLVVHTTGCPFPFDHILN